MKPNHFRHGFTLIELMVVSAIIIILTSIALPYYMETMTRARITQAKSEMRSIAGALEMYRVDWKAYPQAAAIPSFRRLAPLSGNTKYIKEVPNDPFSENGQRGYRYGAMDLDNADRFCLASRGPNRDLDTESSSLEFYPGNRPGLWIGMYVIQNEGSDPYRFDFMIYSPTNGTISEGDLYHASDCVPQ